MHDDRRALARVSKPGFVDAAPHRTMRRHSPSDDRVRETPRESKRPASRETGRTKNGGRASALGLDDDRHLGREALVDLDRDLVRAERLDRLLEVDLVPVDGDPAPAERLGDVLVVDRAVELAALADLHAHRERRRRDAGGRDVGLLALALALLLAAGDVVLVRAIGTARRRDRKLLGD